MTRSDQTQMAVLGALSVMPRSGYALRNEIHGRRSAKLLERELRSDLSPHCAELEA